MESYRIFLSYSHGDRALAEKVVAALTANGFTVLWDKNLTFGLGFTEQIKNFIAHAHIFMPIITEESSKRGWVHQEIGYALALKVPVFPVTKGPVPGEMMQQLHALALVDEDKDLLIKQLSLEVFEPLLQQAQREVRPLFECAEHHEDRTMMLVDYATKVQNLRIGDERVLAHVRQKAGLSSFHLPDKPIGHQVWQDYYGQFQVSDFHRWWLREERRVLESHARAKGCSLIVNPSLSFERYGVLARISRLAEFLEFLRAGRVADLVIALNDRMTEGENITILGDWFLAQAIAPVSGKGYRQTIFTRHAPSIRARLELFEEELEQLLQERGWTRQDSRQKAAMEIEEILHAEIDRLLNDPEKLAAVSPADPEAAIDKLNRLRKKIRLTAAG